MCIYTYIHIYIYIYIYIYYIAHNNTPRHILYGMYGGLSQNNNFREHSRRKQKKPKLGILDGAKNVSGGFGFDSLQSNPLKPFSQEQRLLHPGPAGDVRGNHLSNKLWRS